jgi:lipopolysaccharide exporter
MGKSHILSGIRWTLVTSIVRRLLTLILFYFIARWLSKEDLGVFREYSLILGLVSIISTISLDYNYIIEQRNFKTGIVALWQAAFIGSVIGIILLSLCSGLIGMLYGSTVLAKLFSYTSLFIVTENIRRSARAVAARNKQFRELAMAETWNVVFYSILSFAALYFFRSVWVYVVIFYLGNVLEAVYLWRLNSVTIQRAVSLLIKRKEVFCATLKRFRGFISQATLFSVVNQFSGNAPILIMGMIVEPVYAGLYFFASQLIGVPVGMLNASVNQVVFPVIAEKRDGEIAAMADRYMRLVGNLGLPLLLLFSFVMMYAVSWLLGDKWGDAIPLIPAMFLVYGTSLYSNVIGGVTFIRRKPGWALVWTSMSLIVKTCAMLWGLQTSFYHAVLAYAVTGALMNVCFNLMSMHLIKVDFIPALRKVLISMIPALVYALLLILVSRLTAVLAALCAVLLFGLVLLTLDIIQKGKLRSDVKAILNIS